MMYFKLMISKKKIQVGDDKGKEIYEINVSLDEDTATMCANVISGLAIALGKDTEHNKPGRSDSFENVFIQPLIEKLGLLETKNLRDLLAKLHVDNIDTTDGTEVNYTADDPSSYNYPVQNGDYDVEPDPTADEHETNEIDNEDNI